MADLAGACKNVVIVSTSWWDSKLWFRRQHFAQRFAEHGWKVLYVEPHITLLRPFKKKAELSVLKLIAFMQDRKISEGLKVISLPPGIPFENRYTEIMEWNKRIFSYYIEYKAMQYFEKKEYILICYDPFDAYLKMKNCSLMIYECVDEHAGYPENARIKNKIHEAEMLLVKKADIVTATSTSLKEMKSMWRHDIYFSPNGVNVNTYERGCCEKIPLELEKIRRPIIIYVGAIFEWFNLGLVKKICMDRPEWSIVLIGPERILSKEKILPDNLRYLGAKHWRNIPSYIKSADLGIIPFVENELTMNVNPLKVYEYFAAGLACVSSFIWELKKYEEPYVLEIARDEVSFIAAIERNLRNKDYNYEKRVAIAREHSWDYIFNSFMNLILGKMKNMKGY
jgi:hypothetical protein